MFGITYKNTAYFQRQLKESNMINEDKPVKHLKQMTEYIQFHLKHLNLRPVGKCLKLYLLAPWQGKNLQMNFQIISCILKQVIKWHFQFQAIKITNLRTVKGPEMLFTLYEITPKYV